MEVLSRLFVIIASIVLQVWVNAAAQNFNSIGIAFGSMITYGSYNKKETRIFRYAKISGTIVLTY